VVKTQVQIPDMLFREAKRLAAENEMSFAEVVRRGLEEIMRHGVTDFATSNEKDFAGQGFTRVWNPLLPV
jgi:hypothetical protein